MRFIESRNSELKLKVTVNIYKTISAFANLDGGSIYIGVDDWGKVVGIDNVKKLKIDAENTIKDTFMPKPVIDFITHDIEEKKVLELKVKKGNNPPYFYKNIAYTRIDISTVAMDHSYNKTKEKPSFIIDAYQLKIILPVVDYEYDKLSEKEGIIAYLRAHPNSSRLEIENKLKIKKDALLRRLNSLIEEKIIQKSGSGANTNYHL